MVDVRNQIGAEVGGWKLIRNIGRGADGIVYAGENHAGDIAAIKLYFPEILEKYGKEIALRRLELQFGLAGKKTIQT